MQLTGVIAGNVLNVELVGEVLELVCMEKTRYGSVSMRGRRGRTISRSDYRNAPSGKGLPSAAAFAESLGFALAAASTGADAACAVSVSDEVIKACNLLCGVVVVT